MKNRYEDSGYLWKAQQRWHRQVLAILVGSFLFLAACSAGEEATEVASDDSEASPVVSTDEGSSTEVDRVETETGLGDQEAASDPEVVRAPTETGRLIRRDASVTIEVEDLSAAVKEATDTVVVGDSYLAGEQTNERSSLLTFKVRSEDFDRVLEGLPEIGKLRSQQVTSDDRTDTITDLRSQLETAETSLERTRGFFEQATTVEDLTQVEAEVAQREAKVASLKAQLENEEGSVALSTITVSLVLADDQPVELDEEPDISALDALSNGFSALISVLSALFVVLAWLLPWLPIIVAVFFGLRWLRRRAVQRRRQRPMPQPMASQQMGVPGQPQYPHPQHQNPVQSVESSGPQATFEAKETLSGDITIDAGDETEV